MKKLADTLVKAAALEARMTGRPVEDSYVKQMQLWGLGIFRIVVMGEVKKGKSSFINALLGIENLVPVSSDVATSTIYKIHYGENISYRVFFTRESAKPELLITEKELHAFGTEDGNPGNEKQVDFIEVCCPSPLLKNGVVLIDTPGLGGLFRDHRKVTYQYIPKADAVFFVTDSVESPVGELETDYLRDISAITKHIYFIQTKSCSVDREAREARRTNNLKILSGCLMKPMEQIPYFMVDSVLRHEAKQYNDADDLLSSGYPALISYVNQVLLPAQHKIVTEHAMLLASPVLQHLRELVKEKTELMAADTAEKQKAVQENISRKQTQLAEWETRKKGEILRTLSRELETIQQAAMQQIAVCRPGGDVQMEFETMIMNSSDRESLAEVLSSIQDRLPHYASRCAQAASQKMQQETETMLRGLQLPLLHEEIKVSENRITSVNALHLSRVSQELENSTDYFQTIRTGLYGGMAGMTIASVVGGVVGSVIPVVGTIIGSGLGMMIAGAWGGYKAGEYQDAQTLKSNQAQAVSAVSSALSSAYNKMQDCIRASFIEIRSAAQDAVIDALQRQDAELKKQLDSVRNRAKADAETLSKMQQECSAAKLALDDINREVAQAMA